MRPRPEREASAKPDTGAGGRAGGDVEKVVAKPECYA